MAKIAELQEYLKEIRQAKKMEEDAEILRSIRGMKLGTWDLYNMLSGIRDGTVSMELHELPEEENTQGSPQENGEEFPDSDTPDHAEEGFVQPEGEMPAH